MKSIKTEGIIKFAIIGVFAAAAAYFWPSYHRLMPLGDDNSKSGLAEITSLSPQTPLSLITEPDQGMSFLSYAIGQAHQSVDLVIYELDDQAIEQALADAEKRGVSVRVILDNSSHFGNRPNQTTYDYLHGQGVPVRWAPSYFPITHQKTLVIDNAWALIMTFNLMPRYYDSGRDFGIVDDDKNDVTAIENAFDSDWQGLGVKAGNGDDLVWSPESADTLLALIGSASRSLDIYNEEMADQRIIQALESAANRGVQVRITMTYATTWKNAFAKLTVKGVNLRTYASSAKFYIHAKVIIADSTRAFVGSENFSTQSLQSNRELGILFSKPEIVSSLENTFDGDWSSARPFIPKPGN
jgi:cardiolipin synthase